MVYANPDVLGILIFVTKITGDCLDKETYCSRMQRSVKTLFTNPGNDYNYDAWSRIKKYMMQWTSCCLVSNTENVGKQKQREKKIVVNDNADINPKNEPHIWTPWKCHGVRCRRYWQRVSQTWYVMWCCLTLPLALATLLRLVGILLNGFGN